MMRIPIFLALSLVLVPAGAGAASPAGDAAAGRRLYWEGVSSTGEPIKARAQGDTEISGVQFTCVSCHRPSGYGSSEGGQYAPPILGDLLYEASSGDRNRLFHELYEEVQSKEFWAKIRDPRLRPAYTDKTLAAALITGRDPTGRELSASMPRFALSEQDAANIIAFLKTMSIAPDPGVGPDEIHFATVFTENADPEKRAAVIDTMNAFFRWKNIDTEGDLSNPGFSPLYRSGFLSTYRAWRLDVWELKGRPETWRDQLDAYYKANPVFAVVGGIVDGPHAPVADFCDSSGTPCVFPITELPLTRRSQYDYSLYFSRGRELEGESLAKFLVEENGVREIAQYYLEDNLGAASAVAFLKYAQARGARVVSKGFSTAEHLQAAFEDCCEGKPEALVVWPGGHSTEVVGALEQKKLKKISWIGLPSDAIEPAKLTDRKLKKRLIFSYPYEKPGAFHPRVFDVRAWMNSRGLVVNYPREQFETYYALTMIEHGLEHLLGDFNREYLIELIEHEAEKNLNIGTHPTLALGPGQRFASKGAYIMRLSDESEAGISPASDWIVP